MPTLEHNAIVEMVRDNPELAPRLLTSLFHVEVPQHAGVAVVESSLDQLIPVELRADLVLELQDAEGALVLAIVVEVQRAKDPSKKGSWPVYVAAVRARKHCPTIVLVVTPDADVAAWASEPIDLGLGFSTVKPLVLGPTVVPEVTDPARAEREAEISILSAVVHGNGPNGLAVVLAALAALAHLDQEHATVYAHLVYEALREPMKRASEAKIMEGQTNLTADYLTAKSGDFALLLEKVGRLAGLREVLLRLVARAGIALTEDDRVRIRKCTDSETLHRWIENVEGAKTVSDVLC